MTEPVFKPEDREPIKPGEATVPSDTPGAAAVKRPLHPATGDIQEVMRRDAEAFKLYCTKFKFFRLDIAASKPDSLYGEADTDGEVFATTPLYVHAHVEFSPSEETLTKYGFDKERDVVIQFSVALLNDFEPPLLPKKGDVMVIAETEYRIWEGPKKEFWYGNTFFPIHYHCAASVRRLSSVGDDRADGSLNVEAEGAIIPGSVPEAEKPYPDRPQQPEFPEEPEDVYG